MKPLALIVEAQTGDYLPLIRKECREVRRRLEMCDYEVVVLRNPDLDAILDSFLEPANRDRICIFHYIGHANGASIRVRSNQTGHDEDAYIPGLAELFKNQMALRLVFMNACLTLDHEAKFRELRPDLTVIVTKDYIQDEAAYEFAVEFYESLRKTSSDINRSFDEAKAPLLTRFRDPVEVMRSPDGADSPSAKGGFLRWRKPRHPAARAVAATQPPEERDFRPEVWPWAIFGPGKFHLYEGWDVILGFVRQSPRRFRIGSLVAYVGLATLVGLVSAYAAHVARSSPAWQAAFSYGLTAKGIREAVLERKATGQPYVVNAVRYAQLRTDANYVLSTSAGGKVGPSFGFAVEALRAFICLIMFLLAAGFLYNEILPTDRSGWAWFRVPYNFGFLAFGLFIITVGTYYHFVPAPKALAESDSIWTFPVGQSDMESVDFKLSRVGEFWRGAGTEWLNPALHELFLAGKPVAPEREEWKRMYLYPYLWYLPYSLVNFVFVAFPLFFVSIKGTIFSFSRVLVYLRAMEGRLLKAQVEGSLGAADAAVSQVRETFNICLSGLRTYLFFMLVLAISGIYEAQLGYLTLSNAAVLYVILAIVLLLLGFVLVSVIFFVYDKGHAKGVSVLNNQGVQALEQAAKALSEFGVGRLFRDPVTAVLMPLNVIMLAYTIYSLVASL